MWSLCTVDTRTLQTSDSTVLTQTSTTFQDGLVGNELAKTLLGEQSGGVGIIFQWCLYLKSYMRNLSRFNKQKVFISPKQIGSR